MLALHLKNEEIASLIRYRLEQAQTALDDAKFLLEGDRSPQSIEKIPSKHTGVISLFDTEFVLKGIFPKELSKAFHKVFELRQVSDYKTFKPISKEKAGETLNNAVHFVEVVTKYLAEQVKL